MYQTIELDVFFVLNWFLSIHKILSSPQFAYVILDIMSCVSKKCAKYKIALKWHICKLLIPKEAAAAKIGHQVCISVIFVFTSSIYA